MKFYYQSSEASLSNGNIAKEISSGYSLEEKIKGIRLEDFLEEKYTEWLPKLSFIKVDVEGYDKTVLESIQTLLKKYKPAIIAECFQKTSKEYRYGLFDFLTEIEYELNYFSAFEENAEIIKLQREDMTRWKHFDFFAIAQTNS